jgi:sulfur-oxidizing protein SoxX
MIPDHRANGLLAALLLAGAAFGLALGAPLPSLRALSPEDARAVCEAKSAKVAQFVVSEGPAPGKAINMPLDGKRGNAERGVRWIISPESGFCIACHEIPALKDRITPEDRTSRRRLGYHGTIGPPLDGVASRYTEGELRLLIVDPRLARPAAIKPPFHSVAALHDVAPPCEGKPILSARQVEDIVAFLKTLK